jgi:peptide/nickel transport system substrate-binding protein
MANTAGLDVLTGKRDYNAVKQAIAAAGYGGEKIVMLVPTDQSIVKQECDVCADMLKQIGMNVDYQAMDWGSVVQRRAMMDPPDKGGWNLFITGWSGLDQSNPVGHVFLRGNGKSAMFGWPDAPKLEALRQQWIDAPDLAAQQKLAAELQLQAFNDVPYVPLGQYFQATAYRKNITDRLNGFVKFWNVRRS